MKEKREIAAAIKYEANRNHAPQLIAKGQGDVARKILEIAKELDIPTYQDEKLARQLHHLALGEEIPPELYQVVAEVLAFIVDLDMKRIDNMSNHKKIIGVRGEKLASKYLMTQGYRIRETNYRSKFGEIDIIAEQDNAIVFVEVKTRSNLSFGRPIEAIDHKKINHLHLTAQVYIQQKHLHQYACRFDAIEIILTTSASGAKINHIMNII